MGRDSNQKLKLSCFSSHEARRVVSRSQQTRNIKHGKTATILQSHRCVQEYLVWSSADCMSSSALSATGRRTGKSQVTLWNTVKCRLQSEPCKGGRKNDLAEIPTEYFLIQQGLLK